jgi:hypothetical protein
MKRLADALLALLNDRSRNRVIGRCIPPPDTIEQRNARSVARYYAQRAYLDKANGRWSA